MQVVLFKHESIAIVLRNLLYGGLCPLLDRLEKGRSSLIEELTCVRIKTLYPGQEFGQGLLFKNELRLREFCCIRRGEGTGLLSIFCFQGIEFLLQGIPVPGQGSVGFFEFGHGVEQLGKADAAQFRSCRLGPGTDVQEEKGTDQHQCKSGFLHDDWFFLKIRLGW